MDPKNIKPTVRYRVQLPSQRMQLNGLGMDPIEQILDVMGAVGIFPDADKELSRIFGSTE